ncbi:hypothetical protein AMECASPLE_013048 [Ameca splendens]|uniref:Uncharacterized protein n=1 Tax=Ameca splendens TaxID=208324 RepID=A0ABV0ZCF1_9TELE
MPVFAFSGNKPSHYPSYAWFHESLLTLCLIFRKLKPEPCLSSLSFVFGSSDFLDAQVYLRLVDYVLDFMFWIKLAASWKFPTPEPRQRRTLSTLQRKYLNIELSHELTSIHSQARTEESGQPSFAHPGSDSLYPWRPDGIYLV